MKAVRCKNKQCGEPIAFINGPHRYVVCDKCGTKRKIYTEAKGIRLKMAAR
jgi:hypothetical protein